MFTGTRKCGGQATVIAGLQHNPPRPGLWAARFLELEIGKNGLTALTQPA
jgi:hypothetical protein